MIAGTGLAGMFNDSMAAAKKAPPPAATSASTREAALARLQARGIVAAAGAGDGPQLGVPYAASVGRQKTAAPSSSVSSTTAAKPGASTGCAFDPKQPFRSSACLPPSSPAAPAGVPPTFAADPAQVAPIALPVTSPPIVAPNALGIPEHWMDQATAAAVTASSSPSVTASTFGGSASVSAPDWAWIAGGLVALVGVGWALRKARVI